MRETKYCLQCPIQFTDQSNDKQPRKLPRFDLLLFLLAARGRGGIGALAGGGVDLQDVWLLGLLLLIEGKVADDQPLGFHL